ncbi:MAG: hypothetical protein ABR881_30710 [Candidatus Sulfotelmatobacter sp.]|jgi:hypothetical protein
MAHLTKKFIASLEPPEKGYRIWYDDEVKGWFVAISGYYDRVGKDR